MRIIIFAALGALICICTGALWADAPRSAQAVQLYNGANPLDVGKNSIPCVVDWNNDGRKDLLMGEFTYGYITLYLNSGTDLNPVFNFGTKVQSGGAPITVTYG